MLHILPSETGTAFGNMAFDASLLSDLAPGTAVFRTYGWSEPAATFGFSQRYVDVGALVPPETVLCRRPTGGGIVDHRNDWTYCLALGSALAAARQPAPSFYCFLHETIGACLRDLGVGVQLAPCPGPDSGRTGGPDQCFAAPAPSDLIRADGRKVAGAALRRTRGGLLVQGSLDREALPGRFAFDALEEALSHALAKALGLEPAVAKAGTPFIPPPTLEAERARFASDSWNRRR